MIRKTPPLGWNSWNTFADEINEKIILETADVMVESGLRDLGYDYVVIDDTWQKRQRDSEHRLVHDDAKFPNGIKYLADRLHEKGLKLGIYSCVGNMTCGQYPGSYEYEFTDAQTFAEWGIDYLKYDYCFKPSQEQGEILYRRMGIALSNCGREILFNACSWGADETYKWIRTTGAHMWRSTVDIFDTWESVKKIARLQFPLQPFGSLGSFNDMDMLIVGMNGKGHCGLTGCSYIQYRTHFSLWAFLGSPLIIGCDIRDMDDETKTILMNKEMLAINQDLAYWQPFIVGGNQNFASGGSEECFTWVRLLEGGDIAIGLFNLSDRKTEMYFCMSEIGLNRSCGKKLVMKDIWSDNVYETVDERHTVKLEPFDCQILRAKVVDI